MTQAEIDARIAKLKNASDEELMAMRPAGKRLYMVCSTYVPRHGGGKIFSLHWHEDIADALVEAERVSAIGVATHYAVVERPDMAEQPRWVRATNGLSLFPAQVKEHSK